MPGELHVRSGALALAALPAWERRIWREQADAIPGYCTGPDQAWAAPRGTGPWAKYIDLPNGRRNMHGPSDDQWNLPFLVCRYNRANNRYWIAHFLKRITACLRRDAREPAARYAGCLGHYLQDSAVPGHNTDNYLLTALLPPPAGQYWNMHKIFDDDRVPDALLKTPRPRLLGRSVPEATFRLESAYEDMIRYSRSQAVAIVEATYAGRRRAARRRLAACMNRATELTASAWHTAFSIAHGRVGGGQATGLNAVSLASLWPELYASQYPYFAYQSGIACVSEGRAEPIRVKGMAVGNDAFCVSGTSAVVYALPRGVFRRFRARIGVHQGPAPRMPARFRLAVERTPADRVAIDLNLHVVQSPGRKAPVSIQDWTDPRYLVYDSGVVGPDQRPRRVDLRLPVCERLILLTCRVGDEFANAVWGRPQLSVR